MRDWTPEEAMELAEDAGEAVKRLLLRHLMTQATLSYVLVDGDDMSIVVSSKNLARICQEMADESYGPSISTHHETIDRGSSNKRPEPCDN